MEAYFTKLIEHSQKYQPKYTNTYTKLDGTDWKCTSKTWKDKLAEDEELRKEIYDLICKTLIMDYKTEDLGIDDVEHSDEPVPEG